MIHRTYIGLKREHAPVVFQQLEPHARTLLNLQAECEFGDADHSALGVAFKSLETAAYHFTGRRHFYDGLVSDVRAGASPGNRRLSDRAEALKAFRALRPYMTALRSLQDRCRPFGPDYLALEIPRQGLLTACCHFTGDTELYAAGACGPLRT